MHNSSCPLVLAASLFLCVAGCTSDPPATYVTPATGAGAQAPPSGVGGSTVTPQASVAGSIAGASPVAGATSVLAGAGGGAGVAGLAGRGSAGMVASVAGAGGMPSAGAGAGAATGAPTFTAVFNEVLVPACAVCHGGMPSPATNGSLVLPFKDPDATYKNLVMAMSLSGKCGSTQQVVPGDAKSSLLFQKLSAAPPCGMRMPLGGSLTDAQIAQIQTWIDRGAMKD